VLLDQSPLVKLELNIREKESKPCERGCVSLLPFSHLTLAGI
jgi:hypothetical protein